MNMDWSGKGFWYLYNLIAKHRFVMFGHPQVPTEIYSQWLTLAATGLWSEDTAVLRFMFGKDFLKRSDYGGAFKARKTTGRVIPVQLFSAHHVAKFASAAQTNLGAQDAAIDIRCPVMLGNAVSVWKEDDRRTALLSLRDNMAVLPMGGVVSVIESLRKHKLLMLKRITTSMKIDYGTTLWYKVGNTTARDCYGEEMIGHAVILDEKSIVSQSKFDY